MFKYLIPIAVLTGAAFMLTGKKLSKLEFAATRLAYKSLSLSEIKFLLDISVKNPAKNAVKITDIELNLLYKGKLIATINKYDLSIMVPGRSIFTIKSIDTTVKTLTLLNELLGGSNNSIINVEGSIKADGLKFPVKSIIDLTTF